MSGYNFKQEEWQEYPLDECLVGQAVIDALRQAQTSVELEGWICNIPSHYTLDFDELDIDSLANPSGKFNDVEFVAYQKRGKIDGRGHYILGFESEFMEVDPDWSIRFDFDKQRAYQGARTILLRYLTLLLQDCLNIKPDEERRKLKVERKAKIEQIKRTTPINPIRLRFMVLSRDHFRCRYCGRDASEVKLHVDHILAKSKGGPDNLANYVTACQDCNLGKKDVLLLASKTRKLMRLDEGQIPSFMALPG